MANSKLVDVTIKSPNYTKGRTNKLTRITPHVVVGQCTAEALGNLFARPERHASCNYGIDKSGRVLLCVDEDDTSWCSSSRDNDSRAITFECASDTTSPYKIKDVVYKKLIDMCVDICVRYGKKELIWISSKNAALAYQPKDDEMIITVHRWFAAKACPGDYLYNKLGDLVYTVNKYLSLLGKYKLDKNLVLRAQPKTTGKKKRTLAKGSTVEVSRIRGNWGYVERFNAWICIKYCTFLQYKLGKYKLTKAMYARQGASEDSKKLKKVAKGTILNVTQKQNDNWGYVPSLKGWINLKNCDYIND